VLHLCFSLSNLQKPFLTAIFLLQFALHLRNILKIGLKAKNSAMIFLEHRRKNQANNLAKLSNKRLAKLNVFS